MGSIDEIIKRSEAQSQHSRIVPQSNGLVNPNNNSDVSDYGEDFEAEYEQELAALGEEATPEQAEAVRTELANRYGERSSVTASDDETHGEEFIKRNTLRASDMIRIILFHLKQH